MLSRFDNEGSTSDVRFVTRKDPMDFLRRHDFYAREGAAVFA